MTKSELLEALEDYRDDDEIEIFVASDPEGNDFTILDQVTPALVDEDGEVVDPDTLDENDFVRDVLILWPS